MAQKKLTDRQRAFILEYGRDFNATQAAIRAGYSSKTAAAIGHENLTKLEISEAIDEEFRKRSFTLDEIIARLAEQASASIGDFIVISPDGDRISFDPEMIKSRGHLIKKIKATTTVRYSQKGDQYEYTTLTLNLHDGQRALELLGKAKGLFKEEIIVNWQREIETLQKSGEVSMSPGELFEKLVQYMIQLQSGDAQ